MKVKAYRSQPFGVGTNPGGGCHVTVIPETASEAREFEGYVGERKVVDEYFTTNRNGIPRSNGLNPLFRKLEEIAEQEGKGVWQWAKEKKEEYDWVMNLEKKGKIKKFLDEHGNNGQEVRAYMETRIGKGITYLSLFAPVDSNGYADEMYVYPNGEVGFQYSRFNPNCNVDLFLHHWDRLGGIESLKNERNKYGQWVWKFESFR